MPLTLAFADSRLPCAGKLIVQVSGIKIIVFLFLARAPFLDLFLQSIILSTASTPASLLKFCSTPHIVSLQ